MWVTSAVVKETVYSFDSRSQGNSARRASREGCSLLNSVVTHHPSCPQNSFAIELLGTFLMTLSDRSSSPSMASYLVQSIRANLRGLTLAEAQTEKLWKESSQDF